MDSIYISELIATRLSHDLSGNIGAVSNAVELMDEGDEDDKEDIYNILSFSSNVLNKRLKFFRLCFGLQNSSLKSCDDLRDIIEGYLSTLNNPQNPITLNLEISNYQIYKVIMPAVMLMADTLVKSGKIKVTQSENALMISVHSDFPLNKEKLLMIEQILHNPALRIDNNPSGYAPLFYLMEYLTGTNSKISFNENTLVIGV